MRLMWLDPDWSRISPEAKSLISRMLTYDPAKRISAADALNDEWITKNKKHTPLNKKVMENLCSFQVSILPIHLTLNRIIAVSEQVEASDHDVYCDANLLTAREGRTTKDFPRIR